MDLVGLRQVVAAPRGPRRARRAGLGAVRAIAAPRRRLGRRRDDRVELERRHRVDPKRPAEVARGRSARSSCEFACGARLGPAQPDGARARRPRARPSPQGQARTARSPSGRRRSRRRRRADRGSRRRRSPGSRSR